MAWVAYLYGVGRRAAHWGGLLLIIAVILFFGFGMPVTPFDGILNFWGHW